MTQSTCMCVCGELTVILVYKFGKVEAEISLMWKNISDNLTTNKKKKKSSHVNRNIAQHDIRD